MKTSRVVIGIVSVVAIGWAALPGTLGFDPRLHRHRRAGIATGAYRVLACADDSNVVKETVETNNCIASNTVVQVTR